MGKPHVFVCGAYFWVERHKNSHSALLWCVVCVCCVLFGWGMWHAGGHVVGLWGNRHCVLFFLLLFLFVNSGREHLMNDRRDCLLLCVIWFAARFVSVVSV